MKILVQTDDKCTNCNGTGYIAPGMPCSYCERTGFHRKWVDIRLDETDKEIERLKGAFKKYGGHIPVIEDGVHKGICEYLKHSKNACSCGFKQALEEK